MSQPTASQKMFSFKRVTRIQHQKLAKLSLLDVSLNQSISPNFVNQNLEIYIHLYNMLKKIEKLCPKVWANSSIFGKARAHL